jgi:hypothetical protein
MVIYRFVFLNLCKRNSGSKDKICNKNYSWTFFFYINRHICLLQPPRKDVQALDFQSGSGSETFAFIFYLFFYFAEPALEPPSPEPHKSSTRSRSGVGGGSCPDCGRIFRSRAMLTKHRKQDHQVPGNQCCGSGMFIPDPTFFHPGSRILDPGSEVSPSRIPDPHQRI